MIKKFTCSKTEYRQENKNSSFIADFGYTYGYKSDSENHDKNTQVHFFSEFTKNLNFENFISSNFNAKFNKVNNDYYLKVFDSSLSQTKLNPSNKDVMSTSVSINLDHEDYSFDAGMDMNEKLTIHESNDRFDYVLPYYNFSTSYINEKIPGLISFKSKGNNTLKNTNNLKTKVINDLEFQSNDYITDSGVLNKFNVYYKNVNTYGKKDPLLKNNPAHHLENIYEISSSWPLFKENENYKNTIVPKISYRINPSGMNDLSGNSTRILYNNVFNINRINDEDSFEEGQSLTIGTNFTKQSLKNSSQKFEYGLATVLRPKKSNNIPSSSTINEKQSNYFGSLKNSLMRIFL